MSGQAREGGIRNGVVGVFGHNALFERGNRLHFAGFQTAQVLQDHLIVLMVRRISKARVSACPAGPFCAQIQHDRAIRLAGLVEAGRDGQRGGEFLVLLGAYRANVSLTVVATLGLLAATLYGLKFAQSAFQGPNPHHWTMPDMHLRESTILGLMMVLLLWIGLYPQPVLVLESHGFFGAAIDQQLWRIRHRLEPNLGPVSANHRMQRRNLSSPETQVAASARANQEPW